MQIKIILHLMEMFLLLNLSLVTLLEITYMFLAALNSFFRNHKNKQLEETLTEKPGCILSSLTSVFSLRPLSGPSESGQFCSSLSPREQEWRVTIVFKIS